MEGYEINASMIMFDWMQAGCPSAESLATKEWQRRLEEYTMPELSGEQAKILDTLIPEEYR